MTTQLRLSSTHFHSNLYFKLYFIINTFSLDIWDQRGGFGVTGCVLKNGGIGGICNSQKKYSLLEFNGFNEIQNAAHELGHRYSLYHKN